MELDEVQKQWDITFQDLKDSQYRDIIIGTKINFTLEELSKMSKDDRIKAMLQVKQDETMNWQRATAKLHYYVIWISIAIVAISLYYYFKSK